MELKISVPVLLVAFNRPDTTKIVFDRIRDAKPQKLYVAVDGPRDNKAGENDLVNEVKRIVLSVDWKCETNYRFNDENQGAEITVSSAISWSLENEESVIVLEDDIVAPISFFMFMQEMLLKYRYEPEIAMVSGCNFTPIELPNNEDYLFGFYGHTWGWGTWKRAWDNFDLYINNFDQALNAIFLNQISNSLAERWFNRKLFKSMKMAGPEKNNWDFCWYYHRLTNELLSVIPRVNLTSNIGIYGLHAKGETEHHFRMFDENFIVVRHPAYIEKNIEYDKYHFKTYINTKDQLYIRIFKKAVRIIRSYFFKHEPN